MIRRVLMTAVLVHFAVLAFSQDWQLDLSEAKRMAKESNRNIILVFSGSDWCVPCMKLEKEIWQSVEFQKYAKEHYIMVRADFPRKKANKLNEEQQSKNNQLAELYNKQGSFPLVVIMNVNGEVIGKTGYKALSVEEYIKHLNEFIK